MSLALILFVLVATATCVSAVGVVASRDVVRMAVWLLFTLIGVALLYFLLGAEFAGAAQIIVYVGGTLVLVVFGVMLTAHGPLRALRTTRVEWAAGAAVGAANGANFQQIATLQLVGINSLTDMLANGNLVPV